MIVIISKKTLLRWVVAIISIVVLFTLYGVNLSHTSFIYVYNISRSPDEVREYWVDSNDIFWDVRIPEKALALTFDDGPHPIFTPQILDILEAHDAKATFFVVGKQAVKFPEIIKRIADGGNEIANHTYNHPWVNHISDKNLLAEIEKTHQLITEITGMEPVLFRPPGGYYNKRIVESVRQTNYKIILWSFTQDTKDWSNPGVSAIVSHVLDNAKSGDIIILHDFGGNRTQTIDALEIILPGLKEKGFEMVTVSELLDKRDVRPVD